MNEDLSIFKKEPDDNIYIKSFTNSNNKRNEEFFLNSSGISDNIKSSKVSKSRIIAKSEEKSELIKIPDILLTLKRKKPIFSKKKKNFVGVFSLFYFIRKFINTLKYITNLRSPKYLSKNSFNIINDLSFFMEIWKNTEDFKRKTTDNHIINLFIDKLKKLLDKVPIFENFSSIIIIWNVLNVGFILFFFLLIPLEVCFDLTLSEEYLTIYYLENIALYFFLFDIIKNLNTAVYIKGNLVKSKQMIIKNYLKTNFLKDMIGIFSIFFHMQSKYLIDLSFFFYNLLRILFFMKMSNFSITIKQLEEMCFIDESTHNILSLFKLIFRIILLSHIFACLWYFIGTIYLESSWIVHYELVSESWVIRYLRSYYYVCVTMNTVGYGDLVPQNSLESFFTIIFIYIACGIFAYSINCIGVIVNELAKRDHEFQKDLNTINGFMKKKNINFDLRMRIRKYMEYIWYEEKVEKLEEQSKILDKLSDSLKEELLLEANASILRHLKMFSLNFSEELLRDTVPLLREVRFTPGDIIFMKGNSDNKDFYIIRKGKVELFIETHKQNSPITVLKTLEKGENFGEIAFFAGKEREACARSIDFTSTYVIKKEDFITLLKKHDHDYQRFCEMKDDINLYENYNDLHIKCYSCKEPTHLINHCPNLNYHPFKDIILRKYFFSKKQIRNHDINRKSRKFDAKRNRNIIQEKAIEIQENYSNENETNPLYNSKKIIINDEEDGNSEENYIENYGTLDGISNDNQEIDPNKMQSFDKTSENSQLESFVENHDGSVVLKPDEPIKSLFKIPEKEKTEKYQEKYKEKTLKAPDKNQLFLENIKAEIKDILGKNLKSEKNKSIVIEQSTLIKNSESIIREIDSLKSWKFYFPHNNIEKTIQIINNINKHKSKRKHHSIKKPFHNSEEKRTFEFFSHKKNMMDISNERKNSCLAQRSSIKKSFFKSHTKINNISGVDTEKQEFRLLTEKKTQDTSNSVKTMMKTLHCKFKMLNLLKNPRK